VVILDIVDGSGGGIEPTAPMVVSSTVVVIDGDGKDHAFTTAFHDNNRHPCPHPPPPRPPSEENQTAGLGCTLTCLICHRHSHCCWCHLCLRSWSDGAKDNSCGNRQGHHTNILGREEVGHHNPISVEQQKQKQNKTKAKSTTVAATSPPLGLQTATPVLPLLLPLQKKSQQWQQYGRSSGSSSSRVVAAATHCFELPCSITLASSCLACGIKFPSFLDKLMPV
jgi:hypothetical protein